MRIDLHRPRPRLVAALLIIESAGLWLSGVTWPVPYIPLAIMVAGLLLPGIRGMLRATISAVAGIYAVLFIFPGAVLALFSCGIVNSHCSDADFLTGAAGYALAAVVNIVAARLIYVLGRKPPPGTAHPPDAVT